MTTTDKRHVSGEWQLTVTTPGLLEEAYRLHRLRSLSAQISGAPSPEAMSASTVQLPNVEQNRLSSLVGQVVRQSMVAALASSGLYWSRRAGGRDYISLIDRANT